MDARTARLIRDAITTTTGRIFIVAVTLCLATTLVIVALNDELQKTERRLKKLGLRKLGISRQRSNIDDEYDPKYGHGVKPGFDAKGQPTWRIKALFMFPIKSCAPVELEEATVTKTGIEHDRHFIWARWHNIGVNQRKSAGTVGKVHMDSWDQLTQRSHPKMSQIKVDMWAPDDKAGKSEQQRAEHRSRGCLVISFPHVGKVGPSWDGCKYLISSVSAVLRAKSITAMPYHTACIPFLPDAEQFEALGLSLTTTSIWFTHNSAYDMTKCLPDGFLRELKDYIGVKQPMKLLRTNPDKARLMGGNAPSKDELGWQPVASFADSYPLQILNIASVQDVGSRLPPGFGKFTCMRFRANFYITGPEPYGEDEWKEITIQGHSYYVLCRTTRCNLPNVDPDTGRTAKPGTPGSAQPYKTLKSFRVIDEGDTESPCLGMMAMAKSPEPHKIRVGDEIIVQTRGEHRRVANLVL